MRLQLIEESEIFLPESGLEKGTFFLRISFSFLSKQLFATTKLEEELKNLGTEGLSKFSILTLGTGAGYLIGKNMCCS